MTRLLSILLLLPAIASAAGLGVYNPAQHAVNGFMPTQLPSLQLWLDANRISLTNGASVNVWQDFSGKSNWATNGTASKQPIVANLNGRPALSFDGVDDWMAINSFKCQTYITIFCVVKMQSASTNSFFIEQGPNSSSSAGFLFYGGDYPWGVFRSSAQYVQAATWGTNVPIVAHFAYDGNGKYYKNGIELSTTLTNGIAQQNSIATNTLYIASRNASSFFSKGNFSEVIVFTNAITDSSKIDSIKRYLGTKYGIVVQ